MLTLILPSKKTNKQNTLFPLKSKEKLFVIYYVTADRGERFGLELSSPMLLSQLCNQLATV